MKSAVSREVWKTAQSGHLQTWVSFAEERGQSSPVRDELWKNILSEVGKRSPVRPGEAVLDIGCGLDTVLDYLPDVRGFTLDSLMGQLASLGLSAGIGHTAGAFEQMPFAGGAFDRVFLMNVLDHVRDPSAGLAEIARVMRPGGTLVLSVDTYSGRKFYEKRMRKWWDRVRAARTKHPWVFSTDLARTLLARAGFEPSEAVHVVGTKDRRSFFTATRL